MQKDKQIKASISYKDAGVNISKAASITKKIISLNKQKYKGGGKQTKDQAMQSIEQIGGFCALYELPLADYPNPIIATATDGVGTKLALANNKEDYYCLGLDLVAMCVNDIICCGADPKLFLDYYACGRLNDKQMMAVIKGIYAGCEAAGMRLAGGETAEMPGIYTKDDFDIAGFAVGLVDKSEIIIPHSSNASQESNIVGVESTGMHANGFSLVRRLIKEQRINLNQKINNKSLRSLLMTPTKIYVNCIQQIKDKINIQGLAHITGGGITENLPRAVPDGLGILINSASIKGDESNYKLFSLLQQASNLSDEYMFGTFNCGIGMAIVHPATQTTKLLRLLKDTGEKARLIGKLVSPNDTSDKHKKVLYIK